MKALLGLIEPTYGDIEVMGVDMRDHPEDVYRVMGFMPDFPPVYEDLLVWEFLDLFAASYGTPRASGGRRSTGTSRWWAWPRSGSRWWSSCREACGNG